MLKTYIAVKALIKNKDAFLVIKDSESNQYNDLSGWETPGGRLEDGENITDGLSREIKEETGLDVKILFPFNAYSANVGQENSIIGINYIVEYAGGEIILSKEHSRYQWANIGELKKLSDSIGLQKELDAYERFSELVNLPNNGR